MVDNRTRDTPITGMTDNFNSNSKIADQQHTWVPETETFKRAFPTRKGGCCTRERERAKHGVTSLQLDERLASGRLSTLGHMGAASDRYGTQHWRGGWRLYEVQP